MSLNHGLVLGSGLDVKKCIMDNNAETKFTN